MKVLAAAGRHAEAIKHYNSLEHTLWKQLRTVPSETTRELMESIRSRSLERIAIPTVESSGSLGGIVESQSYGMNSAATADTSVSGLPEALTRFFGRETEMDYLTRALDPVQEEPDPTRLFTLIGPGGAGKTRLGVEAARRLHDTYGGVVWFIPLTSVNSASHLRAALSEALCPHNPRMAESIEQLARVIGTSPGLLILDNFEQIAEEAALTVRSLLERAPGLRCLVTSRQRLNIEGEQQISLPPLPTPDTENDAERLRENPSVQLFVDRARKAKSDFDLTTSNAADVAALCRRLEGIPLALELAAGWSNTLTPSQLLERLSRRFDLLVSRRNDIDERHRSLLSTITWSYEQLPAHLQRLFSRLSVFRGGWTLESGEIICTDSGTVAESAPQAAFPFLDELEQLRDRSLIFAEQSGDSVRFRMLESLLEFAERQLSEEERQSLKSIHAHHFLSLAEQAHSELVGPDQIQWLHRLEADHHNLSAAVEWSASDEGETDTGLKIIGAVWRFWAARCHRPDAERLWDLMSGKPGSASLKARAGALEGLGGLALEYEDHQVAQKRLNEALAIYRDLADEAGTARTLCLLGLSLRYEGRIAQGRRLLEGSLALSEQRSDLNDTADALAGLSGCAREERDYATARLLLDRAAAIRRITGNHRGLAWCILTEGYIAILQGDLPGALPYLQDSLRLYRAIGDPALIIQPLFFLAYIARDSGDLDRAKRDGEEALALARRTLLAKKQAIFLLWLGDLAFDRKDSDQARERYIEAIRFAHERGFLYELRCALGGLARISETQGLIDRAVCLYAAGSKIEASPDFELIRKHALDIHAQLSGLKRRIDPAVFKSAWDRGRDMSHGQAVTYAIKVE